MAAKAERALRLLIVDDSVEDAEAIVSALRNDGIAVRPLRPAHPEEFDAQLAEQPVDIVVAARNATAVPLPDVMRAVAGSDKDIPIVALLEDGEAADAPGLLVRGARRAAMRSDGAQLLRSIRLEWEDLETRRAVRRLDAQLRETERRCDSLIESSRDPIAYIHEGMHLRANAAYLEMFGFDSFEDVEGMSLLDLVAPQHVVEFKKLLKSLGRGEPPPARHELEAHDNQGNAFPAVMEFTHAMYEGEPCVQIVFRRQELDPELAREVEELRQRDQVTGLLNRPTFLRALEDAVSDSAQHQTQHGLLLVEPDHYQRLLGEIGLDSADTIVEALARRLVQAVADEPRALTARYGEHSLAVLLREAEYEETVALAERIRDAFGGMLELGEHTALVSASIGGVQIGEKIASVTQVLARAHEGVISSAGVGGGRYDIHDPRAGDKAEEERNQAWLERLRTALAQDDFLLHYQPVISLQGVPGAIYEALVRLQGVDGETVSPRTFLPLAEEHGLLGDIDRWVARRAVEVIAERERAQRPVTLMIKVSHASLADGALADTLREALARHGVAGDRLVLQLPEAKVFTHLQAAQAFSRAVEALGCRVGLEQFGVGLDSFHLLSHFTPAFVKLDASFTLELGTNQENQQRVLDIAQRARDAGILSIAEQVQDAGSMTVLFTSGVDYVQGQFLAAPGPDMTYDFDA